LLEGGDRDRAEQLVGQREPRQESLEVARSLDRAREHPNHHALRGPLRTDEEDVLAGEEGQDQPFDLLASLEEAALHLGLERLEAVGEHHAWNTLKAQGCSNPFRRSAWAREGKRGGSHPGVRGEE